MIVLALSTSCPRGSAAILSERGTLSRSEYLGLELHAERIFTAIDDACARAGVTAGDLGAVACDVGPGSFTGVRVSVAAGRGIALALGIPAVGVGSLDAMAAAVIASEPGLGEVLAMIDAKRDEVFVGSFSANGARTAAFSHVPSAVAAELIASAKASGARVVGEISRVIASTTGTASPSSDLPDAEWIGRVAVARLAAGRADPPDPEYVRAPDAKTTAQLRVPPQP